MIQLENIRFSYPGSKPVFDSFSWRVNAGEHWAVVGPSGCGKTTLLKLMAGLLLPDEGTLTVDGVEMRTPLPENALVFQDFDLLPWATVRQNVELGLRIRLFQGQTHDAQGRLNRSGIRERAEHWLDRLGLTHVAEHFPKQISGGQRQRTAIARTLATNAKRLLMDEPFSALDALNRESLRSETLNLCRQNNLSLVIVTHSIEEAVTMGQQILILKAGTPATAQVVPNPHDDHDAGEASDAWRERCAELRDFLR